jgi:chloramphenicol 3-O-phosphotransferase
MAVSSAVDRGTRAGTLTQGALQRTREQAHRIGGYDLGVEVSMLSFHHAAKGQCHGGD